MESVQPVQRCGLCNKPFDHRELPLRDSVSKSRLTRCISEYALKRHGYYCRSRRAGATTRTRSCISCARRKVRCDNKQPECSRCMSKAVKCYYPGTMSAHRRPRIDSSDSTLIETQNIAVALAKAPPYVEAPQEPRNDSDSLLNSMVPTSNLELEDLGGEFINWDDPDVDLADFLNPQVDDENTRYPLIRPSPFRRHSMPSMDQEVQSWQSVSASNISIPTQPSYSIRRLIQRPRVKAAAQRTTKLILHTLKSYPMMMLRTSTLPPYIHPHLLSSDIEESHLEPLSNCMSLMHMITGPVRGSRKLFWRNVRLECERLLQEVR